MPAEALRHLHTGSKLDHALGGFRYVWNNRRVPTILTLFGVVGIFAWSYSVLMPTFARDVLGLSSNHAQLRSSKKSFGWSAST